MLGRHRTAPSCQSHEILIGIGSLEYDLSGGVAVSREVHLVLYGLEEPLCRFRSRIIVNANGKILML